MRLPPVLTRNWDRIKGIGCITWGVLVIPALVVFTISGAKNSTIPFWLTMTAGWFVMGPIGLFMTAVCMLLCWKGGEELRKTRTLQKVLVPGIALVWYLLVYGPDNGEGGKKVTDYMILFSLVPFFCGYTGVGSKWLEDK